MFRGVFNIQWLELKTSPLTPCGLQCTHWERPPDVLSNHQLVISIQLATLTEQLTAERDNSMCFHDHKVGMVPNNAHYGKQWCLWSWTHYNPVLIHREPSSMCGSVHCQGHLSLFVSLHLNYRCITQCQFCGWSPFLLQVYAKFEYIPATVTAAALNDLFL